MSAIFLSYRRDDSSGYAGRLFDNLSDRFGRERVFMDIETLEPGMDFVAGIDRAIESCGAVIAMIGPNWIRAKDSAGRSRLDDPNDFIRLEILAALNRGVRVIPVLVHNASMPLEQELPERLRPLCRLQAYEIADNRWEFDVGRLADILEPLVAEPPAGQSAVHPEVTGTDDTADTTHDSGGSSGGRLAAVAALVVALGGGGAWWLSQAPPTEPLQPPPAYQAAPSPPDTAIRDGTVTATPVPDEPKTDPVPTDRPARPEPPTADEPPAAVEPRPATPSVPRGPSAEELREREIAELLRAAETDLAALRLTRPAGNNALERYQRVLELEPHNRGAREGLMAIAERYRGLTQGALRRDDLGDAQRYLESAEQVDPGADWLTALQREIDERRRRATRSDPAPAPAIRPDRARQEACLSDCGRRHEACEAEIHPDIESMCVQEHTETCDQRYEACISDGSKMYMGQVALESECAGVHIMCSRSLAEECAAASQKAAARCETGFETCTRDCRNPP